jgi:hypothetical protein
MGTNYYARYNLCEDCQRFEEKHIGKSSMGWCFSLHIIPEEGIKNWNDWKKFLTKDGVKIFDENDKEISFDYFEEVVTKRKAEKIKFPCSIFGKTYNSEEEWAKKNGVVLGPYNLWRHKKGTDCEGYGNGTYDYIIGDFC